MPKSELDTQQRVRLEAGRHDHWLMRNNSGAFRDSGGRWVRFGLGNDSKRVNDRIKSSDLVGITTWLVTEDMVGRHVGIFTAAECKPPGWSYDSRDSHSAAQLRFIEEVRRRGGAAGFVTSDEEYYRMVMKWRWGR